MVKQIRIYFKFDRVVSWPWKYLEVINVQFQSILINLIHTVNFKRFPAMAYNNGGGNFYIQIYG